MEIIYIKFENYRNLGGLEVEINKDVNFIVGENNIGKSNFQNGIIKVLSGKSFSKNDFEDENVPLKITFKLHLSIDEIGIFDDLVNPEDSETINIVALQESPDDYIRYYHLESEEHIQANIIKRINVISYDSLRNPKNEIDFTKSKGAGAFLNFLVKHYVSRNESHGLLKSSEVRRIECYLKNALTNLTPFDRFSITPHVEADEVEILSRVLFLKDDNNINIPDNGYGVQFNLLIMLSLLEKIIDFSKKKKSDDDDFSALLIFDEPEIHLHPYLQRAIMKDIINLANGKDEQFNSILREYFDIENFSAQIIITTHSPNIICDDYEKIIRMFKQNNYTKAVSGNGLSLTTSERKQILMQFEYIKEAVFSKSAIVVEGDSEYGSFPLFANTLGIDFDKKGIALIKAGGAESVCPIICLFNKLGIKAVGVIDNDKKIEKKIDDKEYLFFTKSKCFDSEIVQRITKNKNYNVLKKILEDYDSQGLKRNIQSNKLNTVIKNYGYKRITVSNNLKFLDVNESDIISEIMYVAWFEINKGILLGKVIGEFLEKKDIPVCYVKAIRKAEEYADECRI